MEEGSVLASPPDGRASNKGVNTFGDGTGEYLSGRDMEGPSFYCAYLGFSPISKPPTNISVLQNPVRDLYFKYRKTPASGRSASLKLTQQGVLIIIYENGEVKAEIFFEFSSVNFVEAAKFISVKSSSEKKPKALFIPVDESRPAVSEKHSFLVDKAFHFLVSSTHPPLVVCVVRRPMGVKALDCHVFALDTVENALHITALISSAQLPPGAPVGRADGGEARGKPGFDRGVRGDVIRTEYGEYSVYRGSMGYEGPPPQVQRLSGVGPGGPIMAPARNGQMGPPSGGVPGGIMLTQDNFRESPATGHHHQQFMTDQGAGGFGYYDQQNMGAAQYRNKPDVIMHVRQRSGDSAENSPHDRSFNTNPMSDPGVRMRMEEVQMRNGQRVSGGQFMPPAQVPPNQRLSGGQLPLSGRMSPRPQDIAPTSRYPSGGPGQFSPRNSDAAMSPPVVSPRGSTAVFSPTSPRGFDPGPVFSASNLESRVMDDDPTEQNLGGKPVAKVPPHMKAGIKVLPSDFRAVKLKPKAEKPSDPSEESGYDNNKQILEKYKELQDLDSPQGGVGLKPGSGRGINYPDGDGFREFSSKGQRFQEDNRKDFMSQWQESAKDQRSGGVKHDDQVYRHSAVSNNYQTYEDNNNKNRYSVPSYGDDNQVGRQWGGGQKSQSNYDMGSSMQYSSNHDVMDPLARMKNLEIASMFSNYRGQQQPLGGRVGGDMHRPRDRNEFEEGLGYLP